MNPADPAESTDARDRAATSASPSAYEAVVWPAFLLMALIAHPAVDVAIVGARSAGHIEDSVSAATLRLEDIDVDEIDAIMEGAVPVGGPTPESV